ncbi:MAG TPA: nucleotide exchange factor GrpE, partial [Spirochaetia bacterium]|nr:nucleotide exchange factor GrpE [Spirochaetia bacterium]
MSKKKDQSEVFEGAQNVPGGTPQDGGSDQKGGGKAAPAPELTAEERVKALSAEVADLKDKFLRKQADFENFRKRMLREREEAARYANAALLTDLIGLIDDFERAIHSGEESKDFTSFLQGITMIEKQLVEMLESRWGLKRFTSVGEAFDPNKHEAVQRVEGPADTRPTVVEDYQKGYYLHERVLRPARVKVMVPSQGDAAAAENAAPPATGPKPGADG